MENTENNTQVVENKETNNNQIDYTKLEEIVNKGMQTKESAILKSYFQQQGLSEEEVKSAINDFKTNKEKRANEEKLNNDELNNQVNSLKKELQTEKLNNLITLAGYELGLDSKTLKAVQKLADFDGVIENNEINQDKIKESINNVLEEYPQLKVSKTANKIVEVGAPEGNDTEDTSNDKLRKMFGLK